MVITNDGIACNSTFKNDLFKNIKCIRILATLKLRAAEIVTKIAGFFNHINFTSI